MFVTSWVLFVITSFYVVLPQEWGLIQHGCCIILLLSVQLIIKPLLGWILIFFLCVLLAVEVVLIVPCMVLGAHAGTGLRTSGLLAFSFFSFYFFF